MGHVDFTHLLAEAWIPTARASQEFACGSHQCRLNTKRFSVQQRQGIAGIAQEIDLIGLHLQHFRILFLQLLLISGIDRKLGQGALVGQIGGRHLVQLGLRSVGRKSSAGIGGIFGQRQVRVIM